MFNEVQFTNLNAAFQFTGRTTRSSTAPTPERCGNGRQQPRGGHDSAADAGPDGTHRLVKDSAAARFVSVGTRRFAARGSRSPIARSESRLAALVGPWRVQLTIRDRHPGIGVLSGRKQVRQGQRQKDGIHRQQQADLDPVAPDQDRQQVDWQHERGMAQRRAVRAASPEPRTPRTRRAGAPSSSPQSPIARGCWYSRATPSANRYSTARRRHTISLFIHGCPDRQIARGDPQVRPVERHDRDVEEHDEDRRLATECGDREQRGERQVSFPDLTSTRAIENKTGSSSEHGEYE